tara:strand:- start:740 stop:1147 length:408 start_codon:yes stop_codon:yes gene_type:complete
MRVIAPKIVEVFYRAGLCERLMPGLKKPGSPSMYKILEMTYDSKDLGFYDKKPLKLRANANQIACWEMAIDLLAQTPKLENRRLIWAKAMRFSWVKLGKQFGCHRTTIKKRYISAILDLEFRLDKKVIDRIDKLI